MANVFNTLESARRLDAAGCNPELAAEMAFQINNAIPGSLASMAEAVDGTKVTVLPLPL